MKRQIFLLLLVSASAFCQTRVPTVTRTVQLFGDLERKLASADPAAREALLADDFEERLCSEPGTSIARADWLRQFAPASARFSQEAVHSYDNLAVYSAQADTQSGKDILVDLWKKAAGGWKLAVRYRCPATGPKPPESPTPKRY